MTERKWECCDTSFDSKDCFCGTFCPCIPLGRAASQTPLGCTGKCFLCGLLASTQLGAIFAGFVGVTETGAKCPDAALAGLCQLCFCTPCQLNKEMRGKIVSGADLSAQL
jgi:hypothetical protein